MGLINRFDSDEKLRIPLNKFRISRTVFEEVRSASSCQQLKINSPSAGGRDPVSLETVSHNPVLTIYCNYLLIYTVEICLCQCHSDCVSQDIHFI